MDVVAEGIQCDRSKTRLAIGNLPEVPCGSSGHTTKEQKVNLSPHPTICKNNSIVYDYQERSVSHIPAFTYRNGFLQLWHDV